MGPKCTTGTYILQWFINDFAQENTLDIQYIKKEDKNKTKLENFHESILSHFFCKFSIIFFTMSCNNSLLIFQQAYTKITQSLFQVEYVFNYEKSFSKKKIHLNCKALYIKSMTRQKNLVL